MRDYKSEEKKRKWLLGALGLVLVVVIVIMAVNLVSHKNTDTTEPVTLETTEPATESIEETEVQVIEQATPSEAKKPDETEQGLPDDVIKDLKDKQVQEGLTPEQNAEAWEQGLKDNINQTAEATEAETPPQETQSNTEPSTAESDGRDFTIKDPKKPTINADGEIEKDITEKVKDAMLPGSGPTLLQNDSETLKVGKTIKNYFNTDIGRGQVGDTVMLNTIGMKVSPILSEKGYTVKTYKDTAEFSFGKQGTLYVTKVPDLDVTQLSMEQVMELGSIASLSEQDSMNPVGGSYTQYSYLAVSSSLDRAIQYYKCGFGTYQLLYTSPGGPYTVVTVVANIETDETINAVAPVSDIKKELQIEQ